ncbi:MAG TPA: NUDIX domain-containing protein [Aurantimonas coralicida]|uniref:NUDIX domain-containing protein n=2 Tax=root TaxID=1 RepID=A0A9C9TJ31_9HYPH|nr:NUDIX domain-containing protein [Aurantimonas coralicida]HEU02401.1 NUDIX domain-containing protein [Aurantimonas coralicida]
MDNPPARPLVGVSVCLMSRDRVLLVERGQPPFAGRLSLPGGKVLWGERLDTAARRELAEETGVIAGPLTFLRLHEAIDDAFHAVIAVFCGRVPEDAAMQAADDAAALYLMSLADVAAADADGRTTPGLWQAVSAAAEQLVKD